MSSNPTEKSRPHTIVLGNEKGGTGKSTTAMHLVVALLRLNYRVAAIDLDGRQGTLSRYLENRARFTEKVGKPLPLPRFRRIQPSEEADQATAEAEESSALEQALSDLTDCDVMVIDTPGSDSHLMRLGHRCADTLITPVNDSLLDVDVIAEIDIERREVLAPSGYSHLVWEQNNLRVVEGRTPIDWVVLRNRLSSLDAHNKRDVAQLLRQLSQRIGFRLATGFGERVVYRQLFPIGLTLLDLPFDSVEVSATHSHEAGRREIHDLLNMIGVAVPAVA